MRIPTRLLRSQADDLPGVRHRPTAKEQERETHIIAAATAMFARYGRAGISMTSFAHATRIAHCTLRKHFPDLDTLLAEILYRHLSAICAAVGAAPALPPGATIAQRRAARRAAYIRATRTDFSAPTQEHLILLRERHGLPADLAGPIEQLRLQIGDMIAGDNAEAALALLDTPSLQAPQIEAMLAAIPAQPEPVAAPTRRADEPHPTQAPEATQANNITFLPTVRLTPAPPGPRAGPH